MSDYKPEWTPHPLRDAVRAVGRTLREYALLMRLHKPIGIWLLLWPALWGLWIAGDGRPDPRILSIFTVGVVVTRSAGCVINDYADRGFDPRVARTRERPLAAGRLAPAGGISPPRSLRMTFSATSAFSPTASRFSDESVRPPDLSRSL